jgi:hypothetical protein
MDLKFHPTDTNSCYFCKHNIADLKFNLVSGQTLPWQISLKTMEPEAIAATISPATSLPWQPESVLQPTRHWLIVSGRPQ